MQKLAHTRTLIRFSPSMTSCSKELNSIWISDVGKLSINKGRAPDVYLPNDMVGGTRRSARRPLSLEVTCRSLHILVPSSDSHRLRRLVPRNLTQDRYQMLESSVSTKTWLQMSTFPTTWGDHGGPSRSSCQSKSKGCSPTTRNSSPAALPATWGMVSRRQMVCSSVCILIDCNADFFQPSYCGPGAMGRSGG